MGRSSRNQRSATISILVVCEGKAEENCLKHIKKLIGRGGKYNLKIVSVNGKGASNVLQRALNIRNYSNVYSAVFVFFDTDTDYNKQKFDKVVSRSTTRKCSIHCMPSDPCFEINLLELLGINVNPYSHLDPTGYLKDVFESEFRCKSHEIVWDKQGLTLKNFQSIKLFKPLFEYINK
ncbi:RloB domain-containing protein [Formicincola oecophyllae]|uniref:RloB domain-containing protein n=1 Tax=Formicincola oecophyllae TaxID=2558361 RepID=A0A4Y6UA25_9PROT|nr:RloB domain-containing protein [Formicincola oecophyllae]QDH14064.1 RloB domain-containing protein [Formicincola oecophyllae]